MNLYLGFMTCALPDFGKQRNTGGPDTQSGTSGGGLNVKRDNIPPNSTAVCDSVSKEDKDSEEQQTQDEPDGPLTPPMPPS